MIRDITLTTDEINFIRKNRDIFDGILFSDLNKKTLRATLTYKAYLSLFYRYKNDKNKEDHKLIIYREDFTVDGYRQFVKRFKIEDLRNCNFNHKDFIINDKENMIIKEVFRLLQRQEVKEIKQYLESNGYIFDFNKESIKLIETKKKMKEQEEKDILREDSGEDTESKQEEYTTENVEELGDSLWALSDKIDEDDIYYVLKKDLMNQIEFQYNDDVPYLNDFNSANFENNIYKKHIRILGRIEVEEVLSARFTYCCPFCDKTIYYNHKSIKQKRIEHLCKERLDSKGKRARIEVMHKYLRLVEKRKIYLYDVEITQNNGEIINTGMFSFDKNLIQGGYLVNFFRFQTFLKPDAKESVIDLILAFKKLNPVVREDIIDEKKAVDFCKKINLPPIKLMTAVFSYRDYYKKFFHEEINDTGMYLQLLVVFSGLLRRFFKYRFCAINIVGDPSVGKTFIAKRLGYMVDRNFSTINKSSAMTLAGVQGGVNNNYNINGKTYSVFQPGMISTDGLFLADEGHVFFHDKDMNEIIKEFIEHKSPMYKIGAKDVIIRWTPIIFSNFKETHTQPFREELLQNYINVVNSDKNYKLPHERNRRDIISYIINVPLFYPLEYYLYKMNNPFLTRAMFITRKIYENREIDWRNGGQVPASTRILFDFVVDSRGEKRPTLNNEVRSLSHYDFQDFPVEDFHKTLGKYFGVEEKFYDFKNNFFKDKDMSRKIRSLYNSAYQFFLSDDRGMMIIRHFESYVSGVADTKIINFLKDMIVMLQLLENCESDVIEESIKIWAKVLFLKTKRGITVEEYDMLDNSYENVISVGDSTVDDISVDKMSVSLIEGKLNIEDDKKKFTGKILPQDIDKSEVDEE